MSGLDKMCELYEYVDTKEIASSKWETWVDTYHGFDEEIGEYYLYTHIMLSDHGTMIIRDDPNNEAYPLLTVKQLEAITERLNELNGTIHL